MEINLKISVENLMAPKKINFVLLGDPGKDRAKSVRTHIPKTWPKHVIKLPISPPNTKNIQKGISVIAHVYKT